MTKVWRCCGVEVRSCYGVELRSCCGVELRSCCGVELLRRGGVALVAVLRRGGCHGVAAWKVLWRGVLAGWERENEMRRRKMK